MKSVSRAAVATAALSLLACTGEIDLERLRQITTDHEAEEPEAAALGVLEDLALPGKGVVDGECAKALYEAWGTKDAAARAKAHADAVAPCAIPCADRASCEALGPDTVFDGALAPLRGEMSGTDYAAARLLIAPTQLVALGTDIEASWTALQGRVAAGLAVAPGPGDAPGTEPIAARLSDGRDASVVVTALEGIDVASCRGKDPSPVAVRVVFDPTGAAVATKAGKGATPATLECLEGALLAAKIAPAETWTVADLWWGPPPPEPVEEEVAEAPVSSKRSSRQEEPLTVEAARKIVKKNGGQVKYCYEQALKAHPDLQGRMEVEMTIGTDGRVSSASAASSNLPSSVTDCVVAKVKRWTFTRPTAPLVVTYPLLFQPSDR